MVPVTAEILKYATGSPGSPGLPADSAAHAGVGHGEHRSDEPRYRYADGDADTDEYPDTDADRLLGRVPNAHANEYADRHAHADEHVRAGEHANEHRGPDAHAYEHADADRHTYPDRYPDTLSGACDVDVHTGGHRDADPAIDGHADQHRRADDYVPRRAVVRRDGHVPGDAIVPDAYRYGHAHVDADACDEPYASTQCDRQPHRRTDANRVANPNRRSHPNRRANAHCRADTHADARPCALRGRDGRWARELAGYRCRVVGAATPQPRQPLRREWRRPGESARYVADRRPAGPPMFHD